MSALLPPLRFTTAGGWATPYRLMGEGRPIVLVHSLGGSLLNWDPIQPELAAQAAVLVYDWGGHGNSEKSSEPFGIPELAQQLGDLIETVLPAPALVLGVAAGGAIALQCALDRPGTLDGLVLVSPTTGIPPATGQSMRARVEAILEDGMRVAVDASIAAGFPEAFRAANPGVIERYRHEFLTVSPAAYAASSTAFSRFEATDRLAELTVGALLLPGELDPYFPPPIAEAILAARPDWRLEVMEGVGHFGHIQSPALIRDRLLAEIAG